MTKSPNILWIFSDQHMSEAMSCAGDINIETSNMDRLAQEGIRFTNAYSNTPICSPARATVYTGKYASSHGVFSLHIPPKPNQIMLQQVLQNLGYYTCHYGKWHISGGAAPSHFASPYFRPGWDEWKSWENSNLPWNTEYSEGNTPFPIEKLDGYQTDALADMTVNFIKSYDKSKPWFHVVSIEPPHDPHNPPQEYIDQFKNKEFKLRNNVSKEFFDDSTNKQNLIGYYGQIKNLDDNIGKIIRALKDTNQLDDTIIFYFSDHGSMLGSHGLKSKSVPFVESSKIPLIIRYPKKIKQGIVSNELISLVDFFPTILGLLKNKIPKYIEGKDLSNTLTNNTKGSDYVLLQFERDFYGLSNKNSIYRTVIMDNWMYTYYLDGRKSLFDLDNDKYQMNNLAMVEKDKVTQLHNKLIIKLKELNDDFFSREENVVELY